MASYFKKSKDSPMFEVANEFRDFFRHCASEFANVVYVMGNHEHYRGYIDTTAGIIDAELKEFSNIHFLDGDYVDLGGVRFIGLQIVHHFHWVQNIWVATTVELTSMGIGSKNQDFTEEFTFFHFVFLFHNSY